MADHFDVAILGAGPAGEHAANALAGQGRRVLLMERELIGGECSNWACIPTKTLLRPTEVRGESERAAGASRPRLDWPELGALPRLHDLGRGRLGARARAIEDMGVTVVKGTGGWPAPGALEVDGQRSRPIDPHQHRLGPGHPADRRARGGRLLDQPRGHGAARDPRQRDRHRRRSGRDRAGPVPAPLRQ